MDNKYFKLYASCIPVKGYSQTVLCDIHNGKYHTFSNDLFYFINESKNLSIAEINKKYANIYDTLIVKLFDLFVKQNWGFYTTTPERFPDMCNIWEEPNIITNAVIDIDNSYNMNEIVEQLDILGCEALQIRFLSQLSLKNIKSIITTFGYSRLRSIELFIKYSPKISMDEYKSIPYFDGRIFDVIVYDSPICKTITDNRNKITFISMSQIDDKNACGNIGIQYMNINSKSFFESCHFNSCLNRKLCIDSDGNIKNCINMCNNYGNIKDCNIIDIVKSSKFQELWKITKDKIEVCKDCEFRYICIDCRYHIDDKNNINSHPAKCKYNPYIGKWKGENGYVPVEECGKYSTEKGFEPDKIIIENIISKLEYDD